MTLPPERIGDKGQRYVLQVEGYPRAGWNDIAYGHNLTGFERAGEGMLTAPGATRWQVLDREAGDVALFGPPTP